MMKTDMDPEEFRTAGYRVIDWITEYLRNPAQFSPLPAIAPGDFAALIPAHPPLESDPIGRILDDFERLIPPASTHWNHPGFFAYFSTSASGPGILAEALTAALNVNAMLWRTGPAATELEEITLAWLAEMMGLPAGWDGTINDTASSSTLYALAAAREHAGLQVRELGLAGRNDVPAMRVYCSEDAHSSIDKAVIALGLGMSGVRRIKTDSQCRMDAASLSAAIAEDRAAGLLPIAVVATVGTTSTTAIDPVADIVAASAAAVRAVQVHGGLGYMRSVPAETRVVEVWISRWPDAQYGAGTSASEVVPSLRF